jgi:hypothetical protein
LNYFEKVSKEYINASGEKKTIMVAPMISLSTMSVAAKSAANSIMTKGEYTPEKYDFIFWSVVCATFTNMDMKMSDDELLAEIYNPESNGLIPTLEEAINQRQLNALTEAIHARIEEQTSKSQFDGLFRDLRKLLAAYKPILDKSITPKRLKKFLADVMTWFEQLTGQSFASQPEKDDKDVK